MPATHYANNGLLSYEFLGDGITSAGWIGLSTTTIDEYGNGYTEPEDSAYQRQQIQSSPNDWTYQVIDGTAYIKYGVTFPVCTDSWGTIVEIFLAETQSGSDILYHTKLLPTIPTYAGTQIIINPQTLFVTERV